MDAARFQHGMVFLVPPLLEEHGWNAFTFHAANSHVHD